MTPLKLIKKLEKMGANYIRDELRVQSQIEGGLSTFLWAFWPVDGLYRRLSRDVENPDGYRFAW